MSINNTPINNLYPVANATTSSATFVDVFMTRDPTSQDNIYQTQKKWLNTATNRLWILKSFTPTSTTLLANWVMISGTAGTEELEGNTGGPVGPNGSGIIFTVGDGIGITVAGNPATNTLTWSLAGGGIATEKFEVDAFTAPGTNPVVPTAAGLVTVTGGQVPAGTTGNVIQTNSLSANTYTIQVQRSQAVASSTIGDNGVSHFRSSDFNVDANGFVTLVHTSAFTTINRQVFTSTGTYTPSAGLIKADVEVVGGGGGSGGCAATGSGTFSVAGGGGAGGYSRKLITAAAIGVSQAVTIGAAGAGGVSGDNDGSPGGTTSFGAIISATGGGGGDGGLAFGQMTSSFGGAGGAGAGGDFNTTGEPGQSGILNTASGAGFTAIGGKGGNSFFGGGGPNCGPNNGPATGAFSYGGGGGGGGVNQMQSAIAGAAGFAGIVIITEYISA